jgi:hypothetical protein
MTGVVVSADSVVYILIMNSLKHHFKLTGSVETAFKSWWTEWVGSRNFESLNSKVPEYVKEAKREYQTTIHGEKIPYKPLPNIYGFEINLSGWDWVFKMLGIDRRENKAKLRFVPWKNYTANRYVYRQFKRLADSRDNPVLFWRIAWQLMKSKTFQVVALNKVLHSWHRKYPYWWVKRVLKRVDVMCRNKATKIDFKRVYIPKPDGRWRPLGVPTVEWRVYLHMLNCIIVMALRPKMSPNQHAYLPGRGVITCWEALSKIIGDKKVQDIYEFDLTNFFGTVNQGYILRVLNTKFGFPKEERLFLSKLLHSFPKLPADRKLDESEIDIANQYDGFFDNLSGAPRWGYSGVPQGTPVSPLLALVALEQTVMPRCFHEFTKPRVLELDISDIPAEERAIYSMYKWPKGDVMRIVTKPTATLDMDINALMYADDGLFYGLGMPDFPFPHDDEVEESGIFPNEAKSGWVKRSGKWLRPLKFLGLEYNGLTGSFRAMTRKGETLEFPDWGTFVLYLERTKKGLEAGQYDQALMPTLREFFENRVDEFTSKRVSSKWANSFNAASYALEDLFRNSLVGYFISRMWSGSFTERVRQDFSLTYSSGSWMAECAPYYAKHQWFSRKHIDVFNSSSFACHSLLADYKEGGWSVPRPVQRKQDEIDYRVRAEIEEALISFLTEVHSLSGVATADEVVVPT